MKTVHIIVEITVADNVADLYPNFSLNYDDEEDFIESRIANLETNSELDGKPFNHFKRYGYAIRALDKNEAKLIDILKEEEEE